MTPEEFALAMKSFCEQLSGSVTSWLRTAAHNKAVGGVPNSPHLVGYGADVVYDQPVELDHAREVARDLGLTLIREKDHDHLQPLTWRP